MITGATTATMPNANEVTYASNSRVTQIFALSGQNVDEASKSQTNVAKDADVEATYETKGYPATNAVDGKNVMESFRGTKGSKNAKDSLTVTFKNGVQNIDDVRLYFYQTSSSQTIAGYSEPSVYTLEYQDEPAHGMSCRTRCVRLLTREPTTTACSSPRSWPKPFVPPSLRKQVRPLA